MRFYAFSLFIICPLLCAQIYIVHHPLEHDQTAIIESGEHASGSLLFKRKGQWRSISIWNIQYHRPTDSVSFDYQDGSLNLPLLNYYYNCISYKEYDHCDFDVYDLELKN
ncbi:hypothetical protein [Sansalvadorimonas verongulae]|uniref:hypothetical protein n=1 Tax=Sansalvadorimonas verongulae TaxID=2172824 RepID=UPI001E3D5C54|nr:hypothetical protein [Sansalvadorimonas verongulae]MTI14210.1 hypothetical protein [Sansalvadorimonas verongulae]